MDSILDLSSLDRVFLYLSAFLGAFIVALWLGFIFWTHRDIRSRSQDRAIQILSTLIVALLTLPGFLIYLILRPRETLDETYQKTLEEEALLASIESRKVCPGCGAVVQSDWQVCAYCHTRIKKICTSCGRFLELPWQMCPYCATPVPGSPDTILERDEELLEEVMDSSDEELEDSYSPVDEVNDKHEQLDVDEPEES
jgi:RNA polymerase subunit RPABC4/transcription elongation factor Spt4